MEDVGVVNEVRLRQKRHKKLNNSQVMHQFFKQLDLHRGTVYAH